MKNLRKWISYRKNLRNENLRKWISYRKNLRNEKSPKLNFGDFEPFRRLVRLWTTFTKVSEMKNLRKWISETLNHFGDMNDYELLLPKSPKWKISSSSTSSSSSSSSQSLRKKSPKTKNPLLNPCLNSPNHVKYTFLYIYIYIKYLWGFFFN